MGKAHFLHLWTLCQKRFLKDGLVKKNQAKYKRQLFFRLHVYQVSLRNITLQFSASDSLNDAIFSVRCFSQKFFSSTELSKIRDDIKSYGKFAIFTWLKIGGGWVERAHIGKIKTKDRNFHARVFGKIGLKIGGGDVSRSIFSLVKIANLP